MAKGYYETEGSDYLNDSPSVSKEQPLVPEHNHDSRYYQKEESDTIQRGNVERFEQVHNRMEETDIVIAQTVTGLGEAKSQIESQGIALQGKAPIDHTHGIATPERAGFMSEADKQKLDSLTVSEPSPEMPPPTPKTYIHVTNTTVQTLTKETSSKILFKNVIADTNSEFNVQTSAIKVKETGVYLLNSVVEVNGTEENHLRLFLQVWKNVVQDVTFGIATIPISMIGGVGGSTILSLKANDVIDVRLWSSQNITTRGRGTTYEYIKFARLW